MMMFVQWEGSKFEPFIRTALKLIPLSIGADIEIKQDPESGHLLPVITFQTHANVEAVMAVEDVVHEELFRSPVYYIFNEIAIAYEFCHDLS